MASHDFSAPTAAAPVDDDKPASRYDYQFDPQGDGTAARVCRLVGQGRQVLELGCAAGAMSAVLRHHYSCDVTGIEYDDAAAAQARQHCRAVFQENLDHPGWSQALNGLTFDTVVAADVLEHLHDPHTCLRQIRTLLPDTGQLVVSTPSIAHNGVIASLLCNDFSYRDTGLLDRTHVHFFTLPTLADALAQAGFAIDAVETIDAGDWHPEFAPYWQQLPEPLRAWLAENPAGHAFQVLVRARPANGQIDRPDLCADIALASRKWLSTLPPAQAQYDSLAAECQRLTTDLHAALQAMLDAQRQHDQAQVELHTLQASRSWKLTAPLRALARRLRG